MSRALSSRVGDLPIEEPAQLAGQQARGERAPPETEIERFPVQIDEAAVKPGIAGQVAEKESLEPR